MEKGFGENLSTQSSRRIEHRDRIVKTSPRAALFTMDQMEPYELPRTDAFENLFKN